MAWANCFLLRWRQWIFNDYPRHGARLVLDLNFSDLPHVKCGWKSKITWYTQEGRKQIGFVYTFWIYCMRDFFRVSSHVGDIFSQLFEVFLVFTSPLRSSNYLNGCIYSKWLYYDITPLSMWRKEVYGTRIQSCHGQYEILLSYRSVCVE